MDFFYLVFGLVFAGMGVAALPYYRRVNPYQPNKLWIAAIATGAAACLLAVPAPSLGWPVFVLVNFLGFASFLCTALLCRSWRRPIARTAVRNGLIATALLIPVWAALVGDLVVRITLTFSIYSGFVAWILAETAAMRRQQRSVQLDLLLLVGTLQLVIGVARIVLVNVEPIEAGIQVSGEPLITAFLRWVWMALYVGALMAAGGYTIERLTEPSIRDHHERKAFEALNAELTTALAEKDRMLNALSASARARNLGTMASTLAHELNQPLGAMRLNAEYLLQQPTLREPEERRALEQILRDNERASSTIARLRSFFSAGAERFGPIDLGRVLHGVRDVLAGEAEGAAVRVLVDAQPGLVVEGDERQLEVAFLNVVRNGIEAAAGNAGERVVSIRAAQQSGQVRGSITDTGPGIPETERSQVFEMFYSSKPDGMGIGLWLSRAIIQRHGGSLSAASPPGQGAEFRFSLPVHA